MIQSHGLRPKSGLAYSIARLQEIGSSVSETLGGFSASNCYRRMVCYDHLYSLCVKILANNGPNKGPVQSALQELDAEMRRAIYLGYPLDNAIVRTDFCNYLLELVTTGYEGLDTTGTQMGNYKGEWRGGGFSSSSSSTG
jgi:hypothetical protein